jgi:polysaccharide export outer membrane protein
MAQQSGSPAPLSAPPLRIGPGDQVDVVIYDNPDLSGHYRVDEKGEITVPLLGPVRVEGLTAAEAGTTLEHRYGDAQILNSQNAHATVFISEFATQGVTVTGEVRSPGRIPIFGVRMLNDVVSLAGGPLLTAGTKVSIFHRDDPGNPVVVEYDPTALVPVIPQVQVVPGDTIAVPRAGIVYVLGSVMRSGGYILEGRNILTVEKAMALAGGAGPGANTKQAHLVRSLADGKKEDIILNVTKMYKGGAPDVALKDGDILYIPTNNVKIGIERAITAAIGIGTNVVTYRAAYQ